jgi:hypothetical protein
MSTTKTDRAKDRQDFDWKPQPQARKLVDEIVDEVLARRPEAAHLAQRMLHETATRFIDWIDAIAMPASDARAARLPEVGYVRANDDEELALWEHPGGMFPLVAVGASFAAPRVELGVESVVDCLAALRIDSATPIEGDPGAALRRAPLFGGEDEHSVWAVERHGTRAFTIEPCSAELARKVERHREALRCRRRRFDDDAEGFDHVLALVESAVAELGPDRAAAVFFETEREYWQRRNRAAQIQKTRQDRLGLGWGNHDHHTYRSSRVSFARLVRVLETLGFVCRESFYAGAEAGWGAQVLEQPANRIVIFADVDLSEDEVADDFAHLGLEEGDELGTVGLWVGLHGESMLQAGLHHLECLFDHAALRDQLMAAGIQTMPPFTELPYLRQAFTFGERWEIDDARVARLVERRLVTSAQAQHFRMHGAVGSHLENLQREDGYKGFNQTGVSDIIRRTDPRRADDSLRGA